MRLLNAALLALCGLVSALTEADVGVVDWHKQFVGVPLSASPATAPVFHRVGQKATRSVILTATEANVLAGLNPVNGSIDWRHVFEEDDPILAFTKHGDVAVSLSGPGGATLRVFDVLNGDLFIEKRLHRPDAGQPVKVTAPIIITEDFEFITLTNGHTVTYVTRDAESKWTWTAEDQGSLVMYTQLVSTPAAFYVVALAKSYASYTLHVTALDRDTGAVLASSDFASNIYDEPGVDPVALVNKGTARIAWYESNGIKSFALSPKLDDKPTILKDVNYKQVMDVGLAASGYLVALKTDSTARVFRLEENGTFGRVWEFDGSASNSRNSPSKYAGGFDKAGQPYITRLYFSLAFKFASAEIYSPYLSNGKGLVTGYSFPFETQNHGIIDQIAIDAANPSEMRVIGRIFLTTSTGALQLWQHDKLQWTREESLSTIALAEFVELPEKVVSLSHHADETYVDRVLRHISDAQNLPRFLAYFARRFATGSYASASSAVLQDGSLWRDTFGFKQIILAATRHGKLFALDSSSGDIIWSKMLDLGWAAEIGGAHAPFKLFVTQTVNEGNPPEAVLVTHRTSSNGITDTVVFNFNTLNGQDMGNQATRAAPMLKGIDIEDKALGAFLEDRTRAVLTLDKNLKIHRFPQAEATDKLLKNASHTLHFPVQTGNTLAGYRITEQLEAERIWAFTLTEYEQILEFIPATRGPVASYGKVLGDRTTLYKYLNPRLFVLLTQAATGTCGISLIDAVKGAEVYRATVPANAGACDIKATFAENWLVYHHYDEEFTTGQTKGYRLVSVEFYEGQGVDDKTSSSDMSAFDKDLTNLHYYEQTYVFPHGVTAMATTTTKFGITSKDLIVALETDKIQAIPRRLLNPRRPNRKLTTEEQEEGLIPYDALLGIDPRRTLSHQQRVAQVALLKASPTLLESTSLVFAAGLDLFVTRVAPSRTFDVLNENFNKVQLVGIVAALGLAIVITRPIVRNKKLRERWYA
ncbi:DUF1620-domain-containing protein [Cylindrobasidium torrendii FP15055 ss-10]|uniref:ER membrane protein complex subunit 1 n=1 Tax=Cylindrobasidium torrendii FP15055 ss-10 TaxID=1314674 RepID=A0A0D7AZH0_9AGAR|nr:DUF1620-domain-containing protein [Cylindrobasidium torrendii FP15055 ss-10]